MKKILGITSIVIAISIVITVLYVNSNFSSTTRTFSSSTLLNSSWDNYKRTFINSDGRVIDYSQNSITTSEGQSYALLQSVWIDDKAEFDLVWHWTDTTLKRPNDNLFGWQWGKLPNGSYGFISNGGSNAAADADSDIALALILAGHRWGNQQYLDSAMKILPDIWTEETDVVNGKRYLVAGNWATSGSKDIINVSYFAPYAWRIFAKVDTQHDWQSMVAPGYQVLTAATQGSLDKSISANIPPDWIAIDKKTGAITAPNISNYTTNYGYDAMRVPWRVALDDSWNHDPTAEAYLKDNFGSLRQTYQARHQLAGIYTHDGKAVVQYEDPAMYATFLADLMVVNPTLAQDIYTNKIIKLYSNATNSFENTLPYYDQNWLWFGAALYNKQLIPY